MFGKKIQLYLLDGTPNGRWISELSNWTGAAYKIPRTYIKESQARNELSAPGIYFLLGKDESEIPLIYVGEAESVIARLFQHLDGKDFWNEAIVFISKDSNLNKAHIKYLEHRFYSIAAECKRYIIKNATVPTKSNISEAEQAEMEEYIYNAKILINILGHKAFEPVVEIKKSMPESDQLFYLKTAVSDARGIPVSDGFVVMKGSVLQKDPTKYNSLPPGILKRISECIRLGQIVEGVLQEDLLFSSSSAAGAFVTGYRVSGPQVWKTAGGINLKNLES